MAARLQWQVPVVVTYHGDDLLGEVINEKGEHSPFSKLMVTAGQWLARTIDAAIVQSEEMAKKLTGVEHTYIIPHEVDFNLFYPVERAQARATLGLAPERKYLLFAANPAIWVKNFPFAQAVADQLKQQVPDVELVVVYKEPQDRLALYMNACDALIFPSFQEGSPNIVKQAMACNLPIVATAVGDVPDVIGKTPGCTVCDLDINAFVMRLREVLQSCERTQGRKQIFHFDRPAVARRVIQVYEETLRRSMKTNGVSAARSQ
jgi:glycosyltransferase involved in cell wall biosynthesis